MTLTRRSVLAAGAAGLTALAMPAVLRAASKGTVRMMASPYGSQSFIPYVMQAFDLPAKHGFELDRIVFSDGKAAAAALQSGSADMAVLDWLDVARFRANGVDVRCIAPFTTYVSVYAAPTASPIQGMADLKGKKMGAFAKNGVDWIMFKAAALRDHGFDPDKEIEVTEGAPTLLRGLMEQGRLDAGLLFSSITPPMIASGQFKSLFTAGDVAASLGLPRAPFLTVCARGAFADENKELTAAYVAAWQEVYEILMAQDKPWVDHGAEMKMEGRALDIYRDQMRGDMLKTLEPQTEPTARKALDILLATAGAKAIGLEAMPDGVFDASFQA